MTIIFVLLDIMIYNFTAYKSFFFLLTLNFYGPNEYIKVLTLGLIIDIVILNTPLINTFILLILFVINKKIIKINKRTIKNYLYINILNYFIYTALLILLKQNLNIHKFLESIIINMTFYTLSYNLCKKYIKLSR